MRKKKTITIPKYGHLAKGDFTEKILEILPKKALLLGLDTYKYIKHLLNINVYPFPEQVAPVVQELFNLKGHFYLTSEDIIGIENMMIKKIKKNIKKHQISAGKIKIKMKDAGIRRKDSIFRRYFPETVIRESDNISLDFLIYFVNKHIKKRFKQHIDGFDKWGLITGFLNDQYIDVDDEAVKKRYYRSKKHIEQVYYFIHFTYPPSPYSDFNLLDWKDLFKKSP